MSETKEESNSSYDQSSKAVSVEEETSGVKAIEIYSQQYQKWYYRWTIFFSVFLVAYAYGLDGSIRSTFQGYATSSYAQHSLISTVNCIRGVVAAAGQIFFLRLSDVFGRVTMLIVAILFYVVGTIIESQLYDVQRFAAGAIFYQIGYTGVILILEVILADLSNLNERVLVSFIPALPFIINTWISGDVTAAVNQRWSWGIGMWAFIFPLACIPLLICLFHMIYLAHKNGDAAKIKKNQFSWTIYKQVGFKQYSVSLYNYIVEIFFWQIDLIGLILMCVIFGCILVPFTLAGSSLAQWRRLKIIAPEVIGWLAIPLYCYWEAKFARFPITPAKLLKDRGVWSALIIGVCINFVWYMQGDYMYTVLIVAVHESIRSATRITSMYSFVSVITGTFVGLVIVRVKRTKPFIIFGVSMWMVSMGLLIHYRGDSGSHSGILGGLCLLGFGAGFFTYVTQLSIQLCTSHEHMAVVLSLYLLSYNIGSSLGSSVSGAVWTNILPDQILSRLPADLALSLYGDPFTFIITYVWGTPEREAVVVSYRYVQKILCIVGLCLCIPLMAAAFLLRNYKMEKVQANEKGNELDESNFLTDLKSINREKISQFFKFW